MCCSVFLLLAFPLKPLASEHGDYVPPPQLQTSPAMLIGWSSVPVPNTCGKGVSIGIIDTDVNTGHAALVGANIVIESFIGTLPPANANHGTAIATLIVGQSKTDPRLRGLLPRAEIYFASVFFKTLQGNATKNTSDTRFILRAAKWLVKQKVQVVNISLSAKNYPFLKEAIHVLSQSGIIIVAAIGNSDDVTISFPAAYQEVIAVSAIRPDRQIYKHATKGKHLVDFVAPGAFIWVATRTGIERRSGTSYSAPFVAAIVALLKRDNPGWKKADIMRELRKNAIDLGDPGYDSTFGWGLVQMTPPCTNLQKKRHKHNSRKSK